MSFTSYQQMKLDKMLTFSNDFKKLYQLIPKEFIHNYYYETFLFHTAEISNNIELAKKYMKTKDGHDIGLDIASNIKTTDSNITAFFKYIANDSKGKCMKKDLMQVTLDKQQVLSFHWEFTSYNFDKKKKNENTPSTYNLVMKLSDDKSQVLINLSTSEIYNNVPFQSNLSSYFLPDGEELSRVLESINLKTQEIVFHEEFFPIGTIDSKILKTYQKNKQQIPLSLLNLSPTNTTIQEKNNLQDYKTVYIGKSKTDQGSRFAICVKPSDFINQQYQKSFESISSFLSLGNNLVENLDSPNHPLLIEISEEDYQKLTNKQQEKTLQLRKK